MGHPPDFIVIGAMKCATTTLHEQLALQPGIFMSRPKEPNFFSDDAVYARGLGWYRSLFHSAGAADLCGESSTHYTKLPTYPRTVARLTRAVPRAKLIYVMRHPVARLISHYKHDTISGVLDAPIDRALDLRPELIAYSRYGMQVEPFLDAYGPENVLPVFFERLVRHPQDELERICHFLGYEGRPTWDAALEAQNASEKMMRRSPLRDALVNCPGLSTIRRRLVPKRWRVRLQDFWRIKPMEPPRLSAQSEARLRDVFDDDLARLGGWLGVELDCDRFRDVASAAPHHWVGVGCPGTDSLIAQG